MFNSYRRSCNGFGLLFVFIIYACFTSCITAKKATYFYDVPQTLGDSTPLVMNQITPFVDPKIEPNDVLAITIQTIAQNESNTPISSNTVGTFNLLNGFLVDKNGYVELSLVGFVKVGGLTTSEAREIVKQKAKEFYKEPVVNLRIANFDIVVMGDVAKPGTITAPSEKISITDVIALSGDLALWFKGTPVLLNFIMCYRSDKLFLLLINLKK